MGKNNFIFYNEYKEYFELLSPEDGYRVLMAVFEYAENGSVPQLDGMALMAFTLIKNQLNRDVEKYEKTLEIRSKAGKKGGRPKAKNEASEEEEKAKKAKAFSEKQTKAKKAKKAVDVDVDVDVEEDVDVEDKDKKKAPTGLKKKQAFSPPSLTEVKSYCSERENNVDPQGFIDFYEAKGWMIGKNKMKDWKAAVRTWERKEREDSGGRTTDGSVKQNQTPWDELLHTEYI